MNIVTIVQARTNSSRLKGKVLLPLLGKPLLVRMIERLKESKYIGKIVVATTTEPEDKVISQICEAINIEYFEGHSTDLLDRHYNAALKFMPDAVVKIPSDCPLIDPQIIDKTILYYLNNFNKYDFVSNLHPPTYPDGNDVEIFSFKVLERAFKEAKKSYEREHTTPYIWDNPDKFKIGNVTWETGWDYSKTYRWTIDYIEDYNLIKKIFEELYPINKNFSVFDIVNLLKEKPYLRQLNRKYLGLYWYENHINELTNINFYKNKIVNNVQTR